MKHKNLQSKESQEKLREAFDEIFKPSITASRSRILSNRMRTTRIRVLNNRYFKSQSSSGLASRISFRKLKIINSIYRNNRRCSYKEPVMKIKSKHSTSNIYWRRRLPTKHSIGNLCSEANINKNESHSRIDSNPIFPSSSQTSNKPLHKIPFISIPGYDRVINNKYPRRAKLLWVLFFLLCTSASMYQCGNCFSNYFADNPAVSVQLQKTSSVWPSSGTYCPSNIFAKTGTPVEKIRDKYCAIAKNNDERCRTFIGRGEIDVLETFYPPHITVEDIWNSFNITPDDFVMDYRCSTKKDDVSCTKPYLLRKFVTAGGVCVRMDPTKEITVHGATAAFRLIFAPKTSLKVAETFLRIIQHNTEENATYFKINSGLSIPVAVTINVLISYTHIYNLNLSSNPCDDSEVVERCIEDCMEQKMVSSLPCRLPFLTNKTLKECETVKMLKQAVNSMRKILNERNLCSQKCPRKCHQAFFNNEGEIMEIHPKDAVCRLIMSYYNLVEPIVKEYLWYTLNYLFSNVGGSLCLFLNIGFLTIFEIVEALIYRCQTKKSHNQEIKKNARTKSKPYVPFISITGFDRILKKAYSKKMKIIWSLVLTASFGICIVQMCDIIMDYLYGIPAVRTTFEEYEYLQLPAISICPYRPFDYYDSILKLKLEYQALVNSSQKTSNIHVSELLKLNYTTEQLWNRTRPDIKFESFDPNCQYLSNQDSIDVVKETQIKYINTIFGTCASIFVDKIRYKGLATGLCILTFPNHNIIKQKYILTLILHNREDDPGITDLGSLAIQVPFQNFGSFTLNYVKKRVISRLNNPCEEPRVVADCQRQCVDDYFALNAPCRLPFMYNQSMEECKTPESFNRSMEVAKEFYVNFNLDFCPCHRKCKETFIQVFPDTLSSNVQIALTAFLFHFKTNLFLTTEEYEQIDIYTLFASICGSLGLFIDICMMTVLEVVEFLFVLLFRYLDRYSL